MGSDTVPTIMPPLIYVALTSIRVNEDVEGEVKTVRNVEARVEAPSPRWKFSNVGWCRRRSLY
jgi:hypothetical protein